MDAGWSGCDCRTLEQTDAIERSFSCLLSGIFPCCVFRGLLFPATLLYLRSSGGFAVYWRCNYRVAESDSPVQQLHSICAAAFILRGVKRTNSCRKEILLSSVCRRSVSRSLSRKSISRICSDCRISARAYRRRRHDCRPGIGAADLVLFQAALGHRIHLHLRAHGSAKLRATDARRNDSPDRIRTPEVCDLCRCAHFVAATPRIGVADSYVGRSVHQNILRRCRLGEHPLVGSDRLLFLTTARIITAAWRLRADLPTKVVTPTGLTSN